MVTSLPDMTLLAFTVSDLPSALKQEAEDDHKVLRTLYNAAVLRGLSQDEAVHQAIKRLALIKHIAQKATDFWAAQAANS